jgi:hypothetical protein
VSKAVTAGPAPSALEQGSWVLSCEPGGLTCSASLNVLPHALFSDSHPVARYESYHCSEMFTIANIAEEMIEFEDDPIPA